MATDLTLKHSAFHLEVDHSELAVDRFLSLVLAGHTVMMSPPEKFADPSYLALVASEAQTEFIPWPLHRSLPRLELAAQKTHPLVAPFLKRGEGMFIVRTSGSSGHPFKLALHSVERFLEKFKTVSSFAQRPLLFFPLDSIAGIETVLECHVRGCRPALLASKPTPEGVWRELTRGEIDSLHVSPSFLSQMMLAGVFQHPAPSQLRRIVFGSEPPQAKVLSHIRSTWGAVELVQGYGMSEIGVLQTITSIERPKLFRLADTNPGRIRHGLLEVRSPCAQVGYLNHEQAFTDDGWFKTQDRAEEIAGQWQILGRTGDLLNVAGHKFFPTELEEQFMAMPEVVDVTIKGEPHDMIGTAIVAHFVLRRDVPEEEFRAKLKTFMETHVQRERRPQRILLMPHTGATERLKKNRRS